MSIVISHFLKKIIVNVMMSLLRLHVANSDVILKRAPNQNKGTMLAALVILYLVT